MRLRQRDIKTVYVRPHTIITDDEGDKTSNYSEAYPVKASIQPLGGQVAAAEYGETLTYMLSMRVEKIGTIKEKDGVCVNVPPSEKPDYEITSIKHWSIPVLEIRKIGV